MEGIVSALARVSVNELLRPPTRTPTPEQPTHVLTIQTAAKTITLGNRPDPKTDAVVRLDGSTHAYTMRGVIFERLFPTPDTPTKN